MNMNSKIALLDICDFGFFYMDWQSLELAALCLRLSAQVD